MSTQSILHKDLETLSDKVDLVLIDFSNKFMLKCRFEVGSGYNRSDFQDIMWLDRLLCRENCRLVNFDEGLKEKLNIILSKYK